MIESTEDLKKVVLEKELKERLNWIIKLRWFASIGVFIVITLSNYAFALGLPLYQLYSGNLFLAITNFLFFEYSRQIEREKDFHIRYERANRFANVQIFIDLIVLTYLIHFSGGGENPFIFYFIFHMVIASILLSRRAANYQATFAVLNFGIVLSGEYTGFLPHHHLNGFILQDHCILSLPYIIGLFSIFTSTLYLTVYLATSIVDRLRNGVKELAIANNKLENQDRLKSMYVMTVSHELKSSLSAIQTCLVVVLSNLTGTISDKAREMIVRAEQRSQNLLHFVKDLLNLSNIRAFREREKQEVRLRRIVEKVLNQFEEKVKEKKIQISIIQFQEVTVQTNYEMMEHVFLNLISNAIKYTPQGGKIRMATQLLDNSQQVQVSLSDTGIGIPREALPNIFDDFYRAENVRNIDEDGTGLGLSIVKQIVEANHGEIWVDSQIGKGSTFTFTLPISNQEFI